MREDHPIDELFRRSLERAEAAPPPVVWDRIRRARRSRGNWPGLNSLPLLLIPFAGALLYYYSTGSRSIDHPVSAIVAVELPSPETPSDRRNGGLHTDERSVTSVSAEDGGSLSPGMDHGNDVRDRSIVANTEISPGAGPIKAGDRNDAAFFHVAGQSIERSEWSASSIGTGTTDREAISSIQALSPGTSPGNAESISIDATIGFTEDTKYHSPVPIHLDRKAEPSLATRPEPSIHVLPKAEWVLSLMIGKCDVKRTWHGEDAVLTQALNKTEGHTSTVAMGVGLGRHWRSGWGLSAGLLTERSEQVFDHRERLTEVTQEVTSWLVTLDNEVYVSNVDTLLHYTTTEKEYRGLDRRSIVRIPVETHFHKPLGRFLVGGRAGLSLEFTRAEQELSLIADEQEGRLAVARLAPSEISRRHPTLIQASIGMDLGYMLTEHWCVWAQPVYIGGALPVSQTGMAWNTPTRFGLQFRLSHHFTPRNRP